jgi:tetratricopeptide (TPR) repeat protein
VAKNEIVPEKITSPIQLLAACFVALIILDGAFLTAARLVSSPTWLPAVLVFAAILNVPMFLGCMFLLQTRFRPEMQSDKHYSQYLKQKDKAKSLASRVREQMDETGLNLSDLAQGRAMTKVAVDSIRPFVEELAQSVRSLQRDRESETTVDPDSLRALAHGELGVGNWLAAARILDDYARQCPDDFEANFSRGVAYANSRDGHGTDIAALRAYNDAVASMPKSLDSNYRARLFTYRGAMLKRMQRFDEALADFHIAETLASNEYEVTDLTYNFASTYALMGDRSRMLAVIRKIPPHSTILPLIQARLGDYFSKFAKDEEFLSLIRGSR